MMEYKSQKLQQMAAVTALVMYHCLPCGSAPALLIWLFTATEAEASLAAAKAATWDEASIASAAYAVDEARRAAIAVESAGVSASAAMFAADTDRATPLWLRAAVPTWDTRAAHGSLTADSAASESPAADCAAAEPDAEQTPPSAVDLAAVHALHRAMKAIERVTGYVTHPLNDTAAEVPAVTGYATPPNDDTAAAVEISAGPGLEAPPYVTTEAETAQAVADALPALLAAFARGAPRRQRGADVREIVTTVRQSAIPGSVADGTAYPSGQGQDEGGSSTAAYIGVVRQTRSHAEHAVRQSSSDGDHAAGDTAPPASRSIEEAAKLVAQTAFAFRLVDTLPAAPKIGERLAVPSEWGKADGVAARSAAQPFVRLTDGENHSAAGEHTPAQQDPPLPANADIAPDSSINVVLVASQPQLHVIQPAAQGAQQVTGRDAVLASQHVAAAARLSDSHPNPGAASITAAEHISSEPAHTTSATAAAAAATAAACVHRDGDRRSANAAPPTGGTDVPAVGPASASPASEAGPLPSGTGQTALPDNQFEVLEAVPDDHRFVSATAPPENQRYRLLNFQPHRNRMMISQQSYRLVISHQRYRLIKYCRAT